MLRTLLAIVLVPVAALLLWLAFGARSQRADFVLACPEPRMLDPQRVSGLPEIQLVNAMFEGLTRLNADTFQPEPGVAEEWEVGDDQTRYTFHLREEARWSNGDPVVAEDFRCAWLRVLDPKAKSQYANLLFMIRGAQPFYTSRCNSDPADDVAVEEVGIEVPENRTLRVTLCNPCSYFLDLTSFVTFYPAHRPTLAGWAYRDGRVLTGTEHLWTRPGNIVCNGAFVLTRWDFKQSIWLKRNPHYWDSATIGIDTIEAYITDDVNVALIAYETGRIDHARGLERGVAEVLMAEQKAGRRPDFSTGDRFATFFYRVNCRRPPLDDAHFRRALSLAIDRVAICEHVMRLGEAPASTFVPRTVLHLMPRKSSDGATIYYEPPAGLGVGLSAEQRGELAREHLRQSGFDNSRAIEIASVADPEERFVAEAIQAMWESVLGIQVALRTIESKVLRSRISQLDYDVARSNWFGDYMDPSTFLDMFVTEGGQNRTGWSNAEYDRLIAAAGAEADNVRRFSLFRAAERILCEDELPIIPIYHRRGNYLFSPRFEPLQDNARDILPIHRVRRRE